MRPVDLVASAVVCTAVAGPDWPSTSALSFDQNPLQLRSHRPTNLAVLTPLSDSPLFSVTVAAPPGAVLTQLPEWGIFNRRFEDYCTGADRKLRRVLSVVPAWFAS